MNKPRRLRLSENVVDAGGHRVEHFCYAIQDVVQSLKVSRMTGGRSMSRWRRRNPVRFRRTRDDRALEQRARLQRDRVQQHGLWHPFSSRSAHQPSPRHLPEDALGRRFWNGTGCGDVFGAHAGVSLASKALDDQPGRLATPTVITPLFHHMAPAFPFLAVIAAGAKCLTSTGLLAHEAQFSAVQNFHLPASGSKASEESHEGHS